MRNYWIIAIFSLVLYSIIPINHVNHTWAQSSEGPSVVLNNIHYSEESDSSRIIVDLTNPVTYFDKYLPNPDRIYIDLNNTVVSKNIQPLQVEGRLLNQVRTGQHDKDTARIVIELSHYVDYKVYTLTAPDRLVVDLYKEKPVKDNPIKEMLIPRNSSVNNKVKQTIVIDPGHGGKDPGAKGKHGLQEKDIVLDVGHRLKELVEKKLGAKVVMTREDDVFIPLGERTAIANRIGADLFVSVHANSSTREGARGVETYLLGRPTDREAMDLAAKENSTADRASLNDVQFILTDLLTTSKKDESFRLAHYVQENMIDQLEGRYKTLDLGVKRAPFYVLVHAQMPSILAEISFISNQEEERLLSEGNYRQEIAESIFEGIRKYLQATPLLVPPKEARNKSGK